MEIIAGITVLILSAVFALTLIAATIAWESYVAMVLWGWFVAPTFGLPQISFALAVGLNMTVHIFTNRLNATKQEADKTKLYLVPIFSPAVVLLVGWIAKQYL